MLYILVNRKPVETKDVELWGNFLASDDRIVKETRIGDISVSTVFMGIGYDSGLFETMIFGGEHDGYQVRYETWEEAEEGHNKALKLVGHRLTRKLDNDKEE